jgi:hypothetical protein
MVNNQIKNQKFLPIFPVTLLLSSYLKELILFLSIYKAFFTISFGGNAPVDSIVK